MSGFIIRRRAAAVIGAVAAVTALAAGSATAYASTAPHKHPVVVPHVPRSLINKVLPSAISPTSRPPGMARISASQDGSVDVGDLGLWYYDRSHGYGSFYDASHNDTWLFNNHFIRSGAG